MKTVGFLISQKKNEKRRCLIPSDISKIKNKKSIFIEEGYGDILGYSDDDYQNAGVFVENKNEVLKKDIICDVKIGEASYLKELKNQTIYGWIHLEQNRHIADTLIKNKLSAYAWEDMFEEGRHVFWRNNEVAGEAAIIHAYTLHGIFPYDTKVALLGRGNVAHGALKILTLLGADVTVYNRSTEKLFQKELDRYDVIVISILWDTMRRDHIIYKEDLKRMKKGALIIDVSCDRNGAVEACRPTTMDQPTYVVDNINYYAVNHTPSIFYKSISKSLSNEVSRTIDMLIEDKTNVILKKALIIESGLIVDNRINKIQN